MTLYLLDTHAALFWWGGSRRLGAGAFNAISDPASTVLVSAASVWEIATKFRIGKLTDVGNPSINVPRLMTEHGFRALDVTLAHGLRAGLLPGSHRDPFDRLIAAQGLIEGATVITRDREIGAFGCEVIW